MPETIRLLVPSMHRHSITGEGGGPLDVTLLGSVSPCCFEGILAHGLGFPFPFFTTFERIIIGPLLRRSLGPRPAYAFASASPVWGSRRGKNCRADARFEPYAAGYLVRAF